MAIVIRDVVQLRAGFFNATRMFRNFRRSLNPFVGDAFEVMLTSLENASSDIEDICTDFNGLTEEDIRLRGN